MNSKNPPHQIQRWHACTDAPSLQEAAIAAILRCADEAISQRGSFHFVLAGGETPRQLYERLRATAAEWNAWHIYFGDERCLGEQDSSRNDNMAFAAWLERSPIPRNQIHVIPSEMGPHSAAAQYATILSGVDQFDLVLLGLGEDGHTASLFPGHQWGTSNTVPAAVPVFGAPKPPPERVSLSAWRLSGTRNTIFLVSGESKREAVKAWRNNADIPAAAITPPGGVEIYVQPADLLSDDHP